MFVCGYVFVCVYVDCVCVCGALRSLENYTFNSSSTGILSLDLIMVFDFYTILNLKGLRIAKMKMSIF